LRYCIKRGKNKLNKIFKTLITIASIGAIIKLLFILSSCSTSVSDGGSGTGSGNPVIAGKVFKANGDPAVEARVLLRRIDYLAAIPVSRYNQGLIDNPETITGNDGTFRFPSVDTGEFNIEVSHNNSKAVLIKCTVTEGDSLIKIPDATLLPIEKIQGNVSLFGGPDAQRFVQVYGLERVLEADASGDFEIFVPKGEYIMKVVIVSSEYKELELSNMKSNGSHVSVKILSNNPISDSWECDTLIVRAILDSNNMQSYSATYFITIIDNGRAFQLDLESPLLFTIPSIIGGMQSLKELEIQRGSITHLPERIGELIDLVELELNENKLVTLPLEITNITKLTELRLGYNKLKEENLSPAVKVWADRFDSDWAETQDTTAVE
jgi:Leucine-rich repeat (LRR) protein